MKIAENRSFDVFISFKNTIDGVDKTRDSEIAKNLYNFLTQRKINVFFSNESLEQMGNDEYRNSIEIALKQAQILIIVGNSKENICSEWVKFEWQTFQNAILNKRKTAGKIFIVSDIISNEILPDVLLGNQMFANSTEGLQSLFNYITKTLIDTRLIIKKVAQETLTFSVAEELFMISNTIQDIKELVNRLGVNSFWNAQTEYNLVDWDDDSLSLLLCQYKLNFKLTLSLLNSFQSIQNVNQDVKFVSSQMLKDSDNWVNDYNKFRDVNTLISTNFGGIVGNYLSKIYGLNKPIDGKPFEINPQEYVELCVNIMNIILDLVLFSLFSNIYSNLISEFYKSNENEISNLVSRFTRYQTITSEDRLRFLISILNIYNSNSVSNPFSEIGDKLEQFNVGGSVYEACISLEKLKCANHKYSDCIMAESLLERIIKPFDFLVRFKMTSLKKIEYREVKKNQPEYLHFVTDLGHVAEISEKDNYSNIKKELQRKLLQENPFNCETVIIYSGEDYTKGIVLFPFIIDYSVIIGDPKEMMGYNDICIYNRKKDSNSNNMIYYNTNNYGFIEIKEGNTSYNIMQFFDDIELQKVKTNSVITAVANVKESLLKIVM